LHFAQNETALNETAAELAPIILGEANRLNE
jgi:bifunctional non-homologous end joining protein LigD